MKINSISKQSSIINRKSKIINPKALGWKEYQAWLKRDSAKKSIFKRILKCAFLAALFVVAGCVLIKLGSFTNHHLQINKKDPLKYKNASNSDGNTDTPDRPEKLICKKEVRALLDSKTFVNLKDKSFDFISDDRCLKIDTSLDIPLQHFMLKKIDMTHSRYTGIVALDPSTGRVLIMAGFDKTNKSDNPCIDNRFPAASIFKIITAAAGVETCGFDQNTKFKYNGRKHTLFKSQLKNRTNKYTSRITLRDSFAQSVNPVFGKIGALYLKKNAIEKYAAAFGFNRNIEFEIPLAPSLLNLTDEPYQWAEIACGFNRETMLSPMHGALITSAILNGGQMIEPTIVNQIVDKTGQVLYRSSLITMNQVCAPDVSNVVKNLMRATINSGTCRKAFKGYRKDHILSRLTIGGKSGSIGNKAHDIRYDWFVGFAEEKGGPGKIAVSVVVAHEKYIGIKSSHYAYMVMKRFFRNYFEHTEKRINL